MRFLKWGSFAIGVAITTTALAGCTSAPQSSPALPVPIQQNTGHSTEYNDRGVLNRAMRNGSIMYAKLYSFGGSPSINAPTASLIADSTGDLYGTAQQGGTGGAACTAPGGCGGIFELTPGPSGYTETTIYQFTGGANGGGPFAGLLVDSKGTFYGITTYDGNNTTSDFCCGTVFELAPKAGGYTETTLYAFRGGSDGAYPLGALIEDSAGALYGTTEQGGDANGDGTVFKLTPKGKGYSEKILYRFRNCIAGDARRSTAGPLGGSCDGANPASTLYMDGSGVLFGTAEYGGQNECPEGNRCGTVFKLTPHGKRYTEKSIYNFKGGSDGATPQDGLIADASGDLYGTTVLGGGATNNRCTPSDLPLGCGTVFKLAPKSRGGYRESVLHAFQAGQDGAFPYASVIADSSGALYGTTGDGGAVGAGSVFELAPNGKGYTESVLYSFQSTPDGNFPRASLIDVSGTLYSTTFGGGIYGYGSVFSVTP
jgi:uncharacterized repeat protein (TIGR03803 family)